ncbi:MAG: T9SS type A sorting domain-containing protein [Bacteroidota bacterium]
MSFNRNYFLFLLILFILFPGKYAFAQPAVTLGADTSVCSSLILTPNTQGSITSYVWNTGSTTPTENVSSTGLYWVEVSDGSLTARDSIFVVIATTPADPTGGTFETCGTGITPFSLADAEGEYLWWDAPTAGNLLAIGNEVDINNDTSFYVSSAAKLPFGGVGVEAYTAGPFINAVDRGLKFDVLEAILIDSLSLFANTPGQIGIRLKDDGGNILQATTVTVSVGGGVETVVPIGFGILPGTNYTLEVFDFGGASLSVDNQGISYPFSISDLINITKTSNNFTSIWYYLYNWKISALSDECVSSRVQVEVDLLPSPVVALGNDTTLCGGAITLDVTNAGASYVWSTGENTSSINISSSQEVEVAVNIGSCTSRDTMLIEILPAPEDPLIADETYCGEGTYELSLQNPGLVTLWWDSLSAGSIIGFGNRFEQFISKDTAYYPQNISPISAGEVGILTPAQFVYADAARGLKFNASTDIIIDSISVLANTPLTFRVVLADNEGNILLGKDLEVTEGGDAKTSLHLGFPVLAGNAYTLVCENISGGKLQIVNSGVSYPYSLDGVVSITNASNNLSSIYYYLFDWKVSTIPSFCVSNREEVQTSVLPVPTFNLGADTTICGNEVTLSASSPGATYAWNTGETTSDITVTSSGEYRVEATLGPCITADSINLTLIQKPAEPTVTDTTICEPGVHILTVPTEGNGLTWWQEPVGGVPISLDNSVGLEVLDTTTLYIQGSQVGFLGSVGIPSNTNFGLQNVARGLTFDVDQIIRIDTVDVYASGATIVTIELSDSEGNILNQYTTDIIEGQLQRYKIPLQFVIPPGQGYSLTCSVIQGGRIAIENEGVTFPYDIDGVVSITGTTSGLTQLYYYLYNWQITSLNGDCASDRIPYTANISLPLSLADSLYSCTPVELAGGNRTATYQWSTGEQTPSITVEETGEYSVLISDGLGCEVVDTAFIDIPLTAGLPDDGILCGNILRTNYGSESTFLWSTGDTTPTVSLVNTGTYTVSVDEPRGCTLTDTISIIGFDEFPEVDLGFDFGACNEATLDAGNPGLFFEWSTGESVQAITVDATGTYDVAVINDNGCTARDTITILITKKPEPDFIFTVQGFQVNFQITSPFAQYTWNFGDGSTQSIFNPVYFYQDTGTYQVSLIGSNSCGIDTIVKEVVITGTVSNEDLLEEGGWRIFPNPTNGVLFVEVGESITLEEAGEIRVLNAVGETVAHISLRASSAKLQEIDLSNLANGIYFVTLRIGDQQGIRRIVHRQ